MTPEERARLGAELAGVVAREVALAVAAERVTLTTMPECRCVNVEGYVGLQFIDREKKHDRRGRPGYAIPWMLTDEWPGLAFELPPEVPTDPREFLDLLTPQPIDPRAFVTRPGA
jgi:hypothetical protein